MRTLLLAGAALVTLAGPTIVHAADIYEPAPGYGAAPPAYQPPPPPAYRVPPRYGYYAPQPGYAPPPPPQVYGPPPAVAYDDDEDVVAPPRIYRDAPVYAERPRYRDCWWEWGQRRCAPRSGW